MVVLLRAQGKEERQFTRRILRRTFESRQPNVDSSNERETLQGGTAFQEINDTFSVNDTLVRLAAEDTS